MRDRVAIRILLALMGILIVTCCTACGGGGSGGPNATGLLEDDEVTGTPVAPTELDLELREALANENVALLPTPPPAAGDLIELGRALFFDKELSGNRNISCATCHHPSLGSGDGLSLSLGQGGRGLGPARIQDTGARIARNAPPLFDLAAQRDMFWDSRVRQTPAGTFQTPEPALNGPAPAAAAIVAQLDSALAAQALFPLTSEDEMRGHAGDVGNELAGALSNLEIWERIMTRLLGARDGSTPGIRGYEDLFAAAFPGVASRTEFNIGHAARAIAAFERAAFTTRGSPLENYLRGDNSALTDVQKQGGTLFFGRGDCSRCHQGPRFTDSRHHAIGIPQIGPGKDFPGEDTGFALTSGNLNDRYRFRTPTLRNVTATGPWMHDGAYTRLRDAVAHYVDPRQRLRTYNVNLLEPDLRATWDTDLTRQDARDAAIDGRLRDGTRLNPGEVDQLVAFLEALTDPGVFDLTRLVPATVPSGLPVAD